MKSNKSQLDEISAEIAAYYTHLNEYPEDGEALYQLGLLFFQTDDYQQASQYLQQARKSRSFSAILELQYAATLKALGELAEARFVLQQLLIKEPRCAAAWNNLGTVCFKQEAFHEAIEAYQSAIRIQADYLDAYFNLGLAYQKAGYQSEAIEAYSALLHFSPTHPGANFQLACVCMRSDQDEKASAYFRTILDYDPDHFEALLNNGICMMKLGSWARAKESLLKAYAVHSRDTQLLYNLGVISTKYGQFKESIQYYLAALALEPHLFEVQYNVAVVYLAIKDKSAALLHFQAASRLRPGDENIQHIIQFLTQSTGVSTSPLAYVRSLFNAYAGHYDAHLLGELDYAVPMQFEKILDSFDLLKRESLRIIDLGCGTGLCGEMIQPYASRLIGVDISQDMLKVAEKKEIYAELICADVLTYLESKPKAADLILCGDILVYLGDLQKVMHGAYQVLAPNGLFLFNLESLVNPEIEADYCLQESGRFAHAARYIESLCESLSFTIVAHEFAPIRTQDQVVVMGYYYLLRKLG